VHQAPDLAKLIRTAREVNDRKPHWVIDKVKASAERFKAPVVACFGLSFKADIDDLRESPAVEIVKELAHDKVGSLLVVEPYVDRLPPALNGADGVALVGADEALRRCDIALLLVNHRKFYDIDRKLLAGKLVIDTRGAWR
jgi:UDP-N-acetyl-D-mannosaminuronic acid dehydrogenase